MKRLRVSMTRLSSFDWIILGLQSGMIGWPTPKDLSSIHSSQSASRHLSFRVNLKWPYFHLYNINDTCSFK